MKWSRPSASPAPLLRSFRAGAAFAVFPRLIPDHCLPRAFVNREYISRPYVFVDSGMHDRKLSQFCISD